MKARSDVNEKKPMDEATKEMDPESREKALRIAHKYQIGEEDPAWTFISLLLDAQAAKEWAGGAAKAAGEAADRIRDEIRSLPDKIRESAGAGAEVVKETVGDAGAAAAAEVKDAGMLVGKALVQVIRNESEIFRSGLVSSGKAAKEQTLEELKADLSDAVNSALKTRFTTTVLLSVLSILVIVAGAYIFGAQNGPLFGPMSKEYSHFLACDKAGWEIKEFEDGNHCFPYSGKNHQHGWRIP